MSIFTCIKTYREVLCQYSLTERHIEKFSVDIHLHKDIWESFLSIFTCIKTYIKVLCQYSLEERHIEKFYIDIHLKKDI